MEQAVTIAFVGHATPEQAEAASAYEDAVLKLLGDHGAELLYRGRRIPGQDESLPLEVHLIRFPNRAAYEAYAGDDRRLALLDAYGEVFTRKIVVELEPRL